MSFTAHKPLWKADDQAVRLTELTADSSEAVKDHPLRRDVRSLGTVLGQVVCEQAGQGLLESVEELRKLMIEHRETTQRNPEAAADRKLMLQAQQIVSSLDLKRAYQITKAFAIYFELTNLAETNHRKRRRRAAELHREHAPLPGSFRGTLLRMKQAGISAEQALQTLAEISITPVFTAHPTEVARQTVLLKRRRIAEQLEQLDQLPLTAEKAEDSEAAIRAEVTSLWQTDEVRLSKPTVDDEIRMGLRYFRLSLFDALPKIYREIAESFDETYGRDLEEAAFPTLVRFGSWIGGDRDGNPLVKPESTRGALEMARSLILHEYLAKVEALSDRLSSSRRQAVVSKDLLRRLAEYERTIPGVHIAWGPQNTGESYRHFLSYMFHKLQQTDSGGTNAYNDASEFEADLLLLRESLHENCGEQLAITYLDPVLRVLRTFGFHLHALDIRQHARIHAQAVAQLGTCSEKQDQSPETQDLLSTFHAIAELKRTFPPRSIVRYIISGAESERDVLSVIQIAEACGVELAASGADPGLMPVPLFESFGGRHHAAPLESAGVSAPVAVLGQLARDHAGLFRFQ
jgi:phosphoenolpyruvate carboxylase